ncbi:MAG TPA: hypothetical protein VGE08_09295 [Steroidobacter sp.]|uniref:hypothetical protein n=1 Tax=Steroidobacter sp. TaxID=1978227 RepID=UPI002EDB8284
MKKVLLVALALVTLLQVCVAASNASDSFCDPGSESFYPRQSALEWEPVPPQRIAEADYHGRIFEARVVDGEQQLFGYRVLMNIRGKPIHVSVALLDRAQETIDVKRLAAEARLLLQNEAMKVARQQRDKRAFVSLSSNEYDIVLWSWRSGWYFSVVAPDRFSVFELAGNTVGYVCTYQQ